MQCDRGIACLEHYDDLQTATRRYPSGSVIHFVPKKDYISGTKSPYETIPKP